MTAATDSKMFPSWMPKFWSGKENSVMAGPLKYDLFVFYRKLSICSIWDVRLLLSPTFRFPNTTFDTFHWEVTFSQKNLFNSVAFNCHWFCEIPTWGLFLENWHLYYFIPLYVVIIMFPVIESSTVWVVRIISVSGKTIIVELKLYCSEVSCMYIVLHHIYFNWVSI